MIILETSFLVDYLEGVDGAGAFIEERADKPFFAATLSLFEVYRGGVRLGGQSRIERLADKLDWVTPLSLTDQTAREAALIEAELHDAGTPINLGGVLVAGICRFHGGRLVTRDVHFERVAGLETRSY